MASQGWCGVSCVSRILRRDFGSRDENHRTELGGLCSRLLSRLEDLILRFEERINGFVLSALYQPYIARLLYQSQNVPEGLLSVLSTGERHTSKPILEACRQMTMRLRTRCEFLAGK